MRITIITILRSTKHLELVRCWRIRRVIIVYNEQKVK